MAMGASRAHRPWPGARTPTHPPPPTTLPSARPRWRTPPSPWPRPLLSSAAAARAGGGGGVRPSSRSGAVTYSASISTDTPIYEPPGVSFEEYAGDRARVFRAMFPDQSRSQRLSDEEWRIQMLPLQFLLLTVQPIVVMQLRRYQNGVLRLRATQWELRGLEGRYMPLDFNLGVEGSLYVERSGGGRRRGQSRLKGHLEITISCILPPAMMLVPKNILKGVAEAVLVRLAEKMKREVDVGLVADFEDFRRQKIAERRASETAVVKASR